MKLEEERKKIALPKAKYPFNKYLYDMIIFNGVLLPLTPNLTILGPRVVTMSRAKNQTVTFTDVDDLPAFLRSKSPPCEY